MKSTSLASGALLVIGVAFLGGCGGGSAAAGYKVSDINATAPSGVSSGQPWTVAKATVKSDGTTLSVFLFSDPSTADCAEFPPNGSTADYMIWTEPAQDGSRDLQINLSDFSDPTNQTVTFVTPPSTNNISVDGILNVSNLTSTSATIGLIAKVGSQYSVNGTIDATFCP